MVALQLIDELVVITEKKLILTNVNRLKNVVCGGNVADQRTHSDSRTKTDSDK